MDEFIQEYLMHPSVGLTLRACLLALGIQLLVGVPIGLFLAQKKTFLRSLSEIIVTLPMIFPPMALGYFLLLVLGRNGPIGHVLDEYFHIRIIFSFWGVFIASFVVGLPFMVKSVQAARQQLNPSLIEAAQTLGIAPLRILFKVVLPNIKSGLLAGILLALGRSVGEVGITLMLGGNITGRTETLSLGIYNAVIEGDFRRAAILSGILSVVAVVILIILNCFLPDKAASVNRV